MLSESNLNALVSENRHALLQSQIESDEVIGQYGPIFNPNNLHTLTSDQFRSFLLIKNNKHWDGIHRQSGLLTEDMGRLRKALGILLDQSRPLKERLDELFPRGKDKLVKGLGRAVATPILQVVYPNEYGVYNRKAEAGLKALGLFPDLPRSVSFAEEYTAVNKRLLDLANELGISLWELDMLWHLLLEEVGEAESAEVTITTTDEIEAQNPYFSLEKFLSNFLYSNWDRTELASKYDLYDEGGETAQEYWTGVGPIDLLARDKTHKNWLVIELKRDRSSDAVVGQILRYMGWVQENLANEGEIVEGMIILGQPDEKIRYALKAAQANISLYEYRIDFKLNRLS